MDRRRFVAGLCTLVVPFAAAAQARLYRIGVIHRGGPYTAAIDGLRDGLKDLKLAEGKQYVLHVRAVSSDLKGVEAAASALELEKVDLIYAVGTTTTIAVKRATKTVPIVFYAGADPVKHGLIKNFAKPGERLTGVHSRFAELNAKRMELLKALIPSLKRVVVFYNPGNPVAAASVKQVRDAGKQLNVELIEREVKTVEELRIGLQAFKLGEADAVLIPADGMVISQAEMVINAALAKKMPTMLSEGTSIDKGGFASYAVSYYTCGRLAAKYVEKIVKGANPGDLPIEQVDTPHFAVNLKVADALGLKISQAVLARADQVIR